jgi:hypothetical protein
MTVIVKNAPLLVLLAALGCADLSRHAEEAPRQKRPVPGDRVTPQILLGKSWKQKGPVLLSARLEVHGASDAAPELLQLEEVPYEIVPKVTLRYFEGDRETRHVPDVLLVRDC